MAPNPKVSVIIPTFNRRKYLQECLGSILLQTLPPSQVIVVNDGSDDDTRELLKEYGKNIDTLETPQLGKPGALNLGLKKVTGDYVWIFDDDDVALPDALERLASPLEKNREYGFSYGPFYYTDSNLETGRIGKVLSELKIPDVELRGFLAPLLEENFLGGAAVFARTACYKTVGEFNTKLLRSQDYEMAIRLARRFGAVRAPGGPLFHYRQHRGARGASKDRFHANRQLNKWLEYDQVFFRGLYEQLALEEYLPKGADAVRLKRQALLQRLTVMATKMLVSEALHDLEELARLDETRPFSEEERAILRVLVSSRYKRMWNLLNRPQLPKAIRALSRKSRGIALLRGEIMRAVRGRWAQKPGLGRTLEAALRVSNLYL